MAYTYTHHTHTHTNTCGVREKEGRSADLDRSRISWNIRGLSRLTEHEHTFAHRKINQKNLRGERERRIACVNLEMRICVCHAILRV